MSFVRQHYSLTTAIIFSLALSACHSDHEDIEEVEDELASIIEALSLTGDPSTDRNLPEITEAKAQLGKALFYTKSLGGAFDSACVSCHHPMLGGSDALSLPVGVDAVDKDGVAAHDILGLGRFSQVGGNLPSVPRNAPTTFNIGFYDAGLFWDSRVSSLGKETNGMGTLSGIVTPDSTSNSTADPLLTSSANLATAQARFPVTSDAEMRSVFQLGETNETLRTALLSRFEGRASWEALFLDAYGDTSISFNRIADSLGAFENSQVFVETPWKAFIEGDEDALTDDQKIGAELFYTAIADGGAGCVDCHSGDFFTDEEHHLVAFPQFGEGKGDDSGNGSTNDFGREKVTGLTADRFHFRTPALLNVEATAPYGHVGSYQTLTEAIRHHVNPAAEIDTFFGVVDGVAFSGDASFCELPQIAQIITVSGDECSDLYENAYEDSLDALAFLGDSSATSSLETPSELTDGEVAQLVAFMQALTDPCVLDRECLLPWILTSDDEADFPDGEALIGIDENGTEL